MSKQTYTYNQSTCTYEPVVKSRRKAVLKLLMFFVGGLTISASALYYLSDNFGTIKEQSLLAERIEIRYQLEQIESQIERFQKQLVSFSEHDEEIYRVILDAESLPSTIRDAGAGGAYNFEELKSSSLVYKDEILNQYLSFDKLKRQIYVQTISYDELLKLAKARIHYWQSIPSIQPIYNKDLTRLHTTYGMRFHPILKIWRPHNGLDFTAPKGTPIYSTGDGVVTTARYSKSLGNFIEVNHGYGYVSRYGHLSAFKIEVGKKVKRGDIIGLVGNTGLSGAAHLHYGIIKDGVFLNPIGFFQRELSDSEYQKLIALSKNNNPSLN